MEPWVEEQQRQWQLDSERAKRPQCHHCGKPITTEYFLDLAVFGLDASVCEDCARWLLYTERSIA